jgi:predicted Zn-ribbon and HTH transcriptional regulator
MSNLSLPPNTVWRKNGWWARKKDRYTKLHYHGCCLNCQKEIWREMCIAAHSYQFCSYVCKAQKLQVGKHSNNWKGGRNINFHGYVELYKPEHPNSCKSSGYICEHIFVMSEHIGRPLTKDEVVHHINENKTDNRIENLQLLMRKEHSKYHKSKYVVLPSTCKKQSEIHKQMKIKRNEKGQFLRKEVA